MGQCGTSNCSVLHDPASPPHHVITGGVQSAEVVLMPSVKKYTHVRFGLIECQITCMHFYEEKNGMPKIV